MKVRLAFSVAAHLEPEILIIDEVLAVGDAEFQAKCLGKMEDVAEEGRTVLFVSHNLSAVISLCRSGIILNHGTCSKIMNPGDAVASYLATCERARNSSNGRLTIGTDEEQIIVENLSFGTPSPDGSIGVGDPVSVTMDVIRNASLLGLECAIVVTDEFSSRVALFHTLYHSNLHIPKGERTSLTCSIPSLSLVPGRYYLDIVFAADKRVIGSASRVVAFDVEFRDTLGTGRLPAKGQGHVVLPAHWSAQPQQSAAINVSRDRKLPTAEPRMM
jgi:lipopolysaccharide transport system ATP-binding protein